MILTKHQDLEGELAPDGHSIPVMVVGWKERNLKHGFFFFPMFSGEYQSRPYPTGMSVPFM
jgi:hypothetical protein